MSQGTKEQQMIFQLVSMLNEARHIIHDQKRFWRGFIITRDIGKCRHCGTPTESGMYKACERCAIEQAQKFLRKWNKTKEEMENG